MNRGRGRWREAALASAGAFLPLAMLVASPVHANGFRTDAQSIEALVDANYAYPERLPGGRLPVTAKLRAEAAAVTDRRSLVRYAERALLLLADHHAITGASRADSWALVPSFSDLWIEVRDGSYVIDAVREGSPAARAGVAAGERLTAVDSVPISKAVAAFWADLGVDARDDRSGFAARVLAAGRRDRSRRLTVANAGGSSREIMLASLYAVPSASRQPVTVAPAGRDLRIRVNDSLGDDATIAAFDAAMARARPGQRVIIDLTDTPSGGNTEVARAIMGWFVERPTAYQVHNLPREARRNGVGRQWVEQVLPRPGKFHAGAVTVHVGRWTGSMGEGLAIGFDAIGARVVGGRMAGLLGAIYDYRLEASGLVIKLPTERLNAVDGTPREDFRPRARVRADVR